MPIPLVTAARRYLMASTVPARLLSEGKLGADDFGGAFTEGWVFAGDASGDPYRNVEGTGKIAIVFYSFDDWAPASPMHTASYPRLRLAIYADVDRTTANLGASPTSHTAENKARYAWSLINPLFHDAGNRIHAFDTLRIFSTIQSTGLTMMDVPIGDGVVAATTSYDVATD